jgi:hypothetical protein
LAVACVAGSELRNARAENGEIGLEGGEEDSDGHCCSEIATNIDVGDVVEA